MRPLPVRNLIAAIVFAALVGLIHPWNIPHAAAVSPVATHDGYLILPNTVLQIGAPGVLGNDLDPDGDPLTAVLVAGVSNGFLTLNPDGSITYQPYAGFVGTDTFFYQADDGTDLSPAIDVTIRVNTEPIATDDAYATPLDVQLVVSAPGILANDADPDGMSLTASLFLTTTFGTLTLSQSDGSFIYSPFSGFEGTDQFAYEAYDGIENGGPATVTITVGDANLPTFTADDAYATPLDTPLVVPAPGLLTNDSDPDSDPLFTHLSGVPSFGAVNMNDDGGFTYTPDPGFEGTDSFAYEAGDGVVLGNTATVTITVGDANHPPMAEDDAYTTPLDTTLVVPAPGPLANDVDPDGDPLTITPITFPAHGTVVGIDPDGGFIYTPDPGFEGPDSLSYQAYDGTAFGNTASITITVGDANQPPVAEDDAYSTTVDTVLTVPATGLLANDSDAEGDVLTLHAYDDSSLVGTIVLDDDGGFVFTPDPGFVGTTSFVYRALGGSAVSNNATVTIEVTAGPDPSPGPSSDPSPAPSQPPAPTVPAPVPAATATFEQLVVALPSTGTGTGSLEGWHNPDGWAAIVGAGTLLALAALCSEPRPVRFRRGLRRRIR